MAEPKEHITDEQIEKLFKLADEIVRAPSRFTKDFVVENLALGVADLCGVIDRLRAQLAEVERLRADRPPLTDEYGMRVTYVSTHTAEGAIADTLDGALEALAAFDAKQRDDVLSRELRIRKVSEWRDFEEGDDRG